VLYPPPLQTKKGEPWQAHQRRGSRERKEWEEEREEEWEEEEEE
jgi:hypothetical protein